MWDDLVNGRTKFHNVFHYPTESWGDVAVIGWLIDGAALVTQKALLDCSYLPYVRAMRRICPEESVHLRHGEELTLELVSGTPEQREMFQDAVNRWWRPSMHFFGPPSKPDKDVLLYWGIKTRSNEDLRQEFFSTYVPKLWDIGISVPDPDLAWNEDLVRMDRATFTKTSIPDWLPKSFQKEDGLPDVEFEGYRYFTFPMEHHDFTETGVIGNPKRATVEKGETGFRKYSEHVARGVLELEKQEVEIHNREFTDRAM
jgi:hypothetical protein